MKYTLLFLSISGLFSQAFANPEPANKSVPPEPELELNIHAAEPSPVRQDDKLKTDAKPAQEKVMEVDEKTLLDNPELLSRAMYSAVMTQNVDGIKVLLPIYRKWPKHDKEMAVFAQALVYQHNGQAAEAIKLYRILISAQPDSQIIRLQLAQALFDNQQNEAAADQFDRLKTEQLPEPVLQRVEAYRQALRQRDSWQVYGGFNITREQNINQAPKNQRLGRQLSKEECDKRRETNPTSDCFDGWTFDKPINATGFNYQLGAEKKWSLKKGLYAKAGADVSGKAYRSYSRYNDATARTSTGLGYADQRNDVGITPFHERRAYGKHAYSYSNGARIHWNRWQTHSLQSLTAVEASRLKNQKRRRSDVNSLLASGSLVYYRNARQYWLGGADLYQERNKEDRSDDFNRYGVRALWGQEWGGGFSTRVQVGVAKRFYKTPSFFSNGEERRDKELNTSISVWHRALHYGGVTPRITFSHQRTSSNDAYYTNSRNRMFIELSKTF